MFDQIYCINLSSRPDRWTDCQPEFEKVGLTNVQRFDAVTGDNRPLAFNQSQHGVLKAALAAGSKTPLILEDDIAFAPHWKHLEEACGELPPDWDLLYLGANIIGMDTTRWQYPTKYSQHLFQLHNCYQTHAIAYSKNMAEWIVENLNTEVIDEYNSIYDEWLRKFVMPKFKVFLLAPMIAYQRVSHSDIWNCHADYTGCFAQGNRLLR